MTLGALTLYVYEVLALCIDAVHLFVRLSVCLSPEMRTQKCSFLKN